MMMENLKLWAISLCGALVITAVFRILLSGSRLEKSVNIFLSVFIFLYAIMPVNDINLDVNLLTNIDENNMGSVYNDGYENIIRESIILICDENNIDVNSIIIDSYIDDNDDYVVKNISIESGSSCNKSEIELLIKNELGFEVDVN